MGMGVAVMVLVGGGVEVGTGVAVAVGVTVGPNSCPGAHPETSKLIPKAHTSAFLACVFMTLPWEIPQAHRVASLAMMALGRCCSSSTG